MRAKDFRKRGWLGGDEWAVGEWAAELARQGRGCSSPPENENKGSLSQSFVRKHEVWPVAPSREKITFACVRTARPSDVRNENTVKLLELSCQCLASC